MRTTMRLARANLAQVTELIQEIIHRFGVHNRIITDLGSQFKGHLFWDFSESKLIDVYYASVAHPRTNGQAERANSLILDGLKSRVYDPLKKYGVSWVRELPHVIWGLRTQVNRATGHTPFFLVYGLEAILPTEQQFWVLLHNHCQLFDICYFGSSIFHRYVHNAKFQFKRTTRHSNLFIGICICHNSYLYVYSTKTCHSFNTV